MTKTNRSVASFWAVTALLMISVAACSARDLSITRNGMRDADESGPIPVKIVKTVDGFQLLRGGKPFFIKGAGGDDSKQVLKEMGGNSYRTWGDSLHETNLDEAQKLGLAVTVGIWLGHKDDGFSYNNPKQVADQFAEARQAVLRYRNNPALLMWGVGNEMENNGDVTDPAVWKAVEDIARMIHQLDPNHPTMTVVAEIFPKKIDAINRYCPDIDVVGINSYGGGPTVGKRYKDGGGVKPFVITEYGEPGTWEMKINSFGAAPELTSTQKADFYRNTYVGSITGSPMCLGAYAFVWGHKREATATWYGLFLPEGSKLAQTDLLSEMWTGKPPQFRAPVIKSLKLVGPDQIDPGTMVHADLDVSDPQGDPLKVVWILEYDPHINNTNGNAAAAPASFPSAIVNSEPNGVDVKMPSSGGGYRLYVYVRDQHQEAATGNIPLFVSGNGAPPAATADRANLPVIVYGQGQNSPYVPSGYEGNYSQISMDPSSPDSPRVGSACLKVSYKASDKWAGVVWQSPANDWGDKPGGMDLTGAKTLSFWARGTNGGEKVTFGFGGLGTNRPFHDTATAKIELLLTKSWQKYTINVDGQDLSTIKTGFYWVLGSPGTPVTFYLDDIRYD